VSTNLSNDPDLLRRRLTQMEGEEQKLWRFCLLMLALLGTALAAAVWDQFTSIITPLRAIPLAAVLMAVVFAVYAASKRRQTLELRAVVRGMHQAATEPPSQQQLGQLMHVISESQRNYRELIDSFDDPIVTFSLHGVIQAANLACTRVLGKGFGELVGHSLEEFIVEPSREHALRGLNEFRNSRHWSGVVKVRLSRPGGEQEDSDTIRYFDCVLNPLYKDGEIVGISALASDVTHLRDRERRFTELFETLPSGAYFSTPEGKLFDCNHALASMLGYDNKEDLLRASPEEIYFDSTQRAAGFLKTDSYSIGGYREVVLRHKTGRPVICIESSRPVFDASGQMLRHQGTLVDITQQRETEHGLRQLDEFRSRLVENFPDGVAALDTKGRFTFVNPVFAGLLGNDPGRLIGESMDCAASPIAETSFHKVFDEIIAGKTADAAVEYAMQHSDGSWRSMRATTRAIRDAGNEVLGIVVSVRDVTGYRAQEQQMIQSERMAAMGQMIDGFAHELNNPLTAIAGSIELLESTAAEQTSSRNFQLLKQQTRRAVTIVQNMLFFARPPGPGGARLDLSEVVQRTIALQEHSFRMSNISVDFIPETSLAPTYGDPNQLMQVFLNLLINAEQAIREVRERGTIRVRLGQNENNIWVSFQDDGPGISRESLRQMFDPFYTTKRPGKGTGLGLSVSMAILKKYSGSIDAQAAPGGGTVFTVSLPRKKEPVGSSLPTVQSA
jgi:PAS domain S-box-containing protein